MNTNYLKKTEGKEKKRKRELIKSFSIIQNHRIYEYPCFRTNFILKKQKFLKNSERKKFNLSGENFRLNKLFLPSFCTFCHLFSLLFVSQPILFYYHLILCYQDWYKFFNFLALSIY